MAPIGVFVSYSRKDAPWVTKVVEHLAIYERTGAITLWTDAKIKAGEKWEDMIDGFIQRSSVAILVVSAAFNESTFIQERELPQLLDRADKQEMTILRLNVRPVGYTNPRVAKLQALNDLTPLATLSDAGQEEVLVKLEQRIEQLADGSALGSQTDPRRPTISDQGAPQDMAQKEKERALNGHGRFRGKPLATTALLLFTTVGPLLVNQWWRNRNEMRRTFATGLGTLRQTTGDATVVLNTLNGIASRITDLRRRLDSNLVDFVRRRRTPAALGAACRDTPTAPAAGVVSPDVQLALTIIGSLGEELPEFEANLDSLNLRGAKLSRTHLVRAHLSAACLRDAVLDSAYLDSATLSNAILDSASFVHASLVGTHFETTRANRPVDFSHAHAEGAVFRDDSLPNASFRAAMLYCASFYNAHIAGADVISAKVGWADFRRAKLYALPDVELIDKTADSSALLDSAKFFAPAYVAKAKLRGVRFEPTAVSAWQQDQAQQWKPNGKCERSARERGR